MSLQALAWAFEARGGLTPAEKLALISIADRANHNDETEVDLRQLASVVGVSERVAGDLLDRLMTDGWLIHGQIEAGSGAEVPGYRINYARWPL